MFWFKKYVSRLTVRKYIYHRFIPVGIAQLAERLPGLTLWGSGVHNRSLT